MTEAEKIRQPYQLSSPTCLIKPDDGVFSHIVPLRAEGYAVNHQSQSTLCWFESSPCLGQGVNGRRKNKEQVPLCDKFSSASKRQIPDKCTNQQVTAVGRELFLKPDPLSEMDNRTCTLLNPKNKPT